MSRKNLKALCGPIWRRTEWVRCQSCVGSLEPSRPDRKEGTTLEGTQGVNEMSVNSPTTSGGATAWWRLGGALGLAWFVLFFIGGVILHGTPPAYDEPIQQAREDFPNNPQASLVGDYIVRLGFVF